MRLHVVSLPHTQTTRAYDTCAFTALTRHFCDMMMAQGHEAFLYSGEENEANCTEHIPVISTQKQRECGFMGPEDMVKVVYSSDQSYWRSMNWKAANEIKKRAEPRDILCLAAGVQSPIAEALNHLTSVEYIAGYQGIELARRVFPSYAWMHAVYGHRFGAAACDSDDFDAVIPHFVDSDELPFVETPDDYFLYVGRLIDRKGWRIAQDVCERTGRRLLVAGRGDFSGYGEYVGPVGPAERASLMGHAQAIFMPSRYLEPFGLVHVEAALCGTPVIASDVGAVTETVTSGSNGFRCRSFAEYLDATERVGDLSRAGVAMQAVRYTYPVIGQRYTEHFEKLQTLWEDGWYHVQ